MSRVTGSLCVPHAERRNQQQDCEVIQMKRRAFLGGLGKAAVTVAAVGTTQSVLVRVIDPQHVGLHTEEWLDGDTKCFRFHYHILGKPERLRIAIGERVHMDASPYQGPILTGVVTKITDDHRGKHLIQQIIEGTRSVGDIYLQIPRSP